MSEDPKETIPTRKVIPPISLVAIICLAAGLIIGYGYGRSGNKFEVVAMGEHMAIKMDKRTGGAWHFSPPWGSENPNTLRWDKMED